FLLSAGWVAALVAPTAFWARRRWESALAAVILLAALTAVAAGAPAVGFTAADALGLTAGIAAAVGARRLVSRRVPAAGSAVTAPRTAAPRWPPPAPPRTGRSSCSTPRTPRPAGTPGPGSRASRSAAGPGPRAPAAPPGRSRTPPGSSAPAPAPSPRSGPPRG